VPPAQGSRVELTIDAGIQDVTERELAAGVAAARAAGGAAVVLDPSTGEVLALANVPAFDPNQPGRLGDRGWRDRVRNRAITDPYEPGSTFKAILAAAANGGLLMRPFLVRRVLTPDGDVVLANEPAVVRRVMSARTAGTVTALLRRVVEEKGGTGERARLDDFPVAGKTGTAQKVNLHTGSYSSKRIGSFVGFVPADRPRVVILVLIDEPGAASYGGVVAAPVFRAIAGTVLK